YRRGVGLWLRLAGVARRADVLRRPGRARLYSRPAARICAAFRRQESRTIGLSDEARRRRTRLRVVRRRREEKRVSFTRPYPWERSYPEGVHWDAPIEIGTVPAILDESAMLYGDKPVIEYRDGKMTFAELAAQIGRAS